MQEEEEKEKKTKTTDTGLSPVLKLSSALSTALSAYGALPTSFSRVRFKNVFGWSKWSDWSSGLPLPSISSSSTSSSNKVAEAASNLYITS